MQNQIEMNREPQALLRASVPTRQHDALEALAQERECSVAAVTRSLLHDGLVKERDRLTKQAARDRAAVQRVIQLATARRVTLT